MKRKLDTICKTNDHDFLVKKEFFTNNEREVFELYCRKCGTVCFLTADKPLESESRIVLPKPS